MNPTRRDLLASALLLGLAPASFARAAPRVEVWRTASCGCCGAWVKHLQQAGFATDVHMVDSAVPMRRAAGIPEALGSCHTAKVGGYALEGHVPAREIRRLLLEKPTAVGLAVPGMPMGSPGMEGASRDPFDVLLVAKDGTTRVYQRYA